MESVCTWNIEAEANHRIIVTIETLSNLDWSQGGIYVASPKQIIARYEGKSGGLAYDSKRQKSFTSIGNRVNVTIFSHVNGRHFDKISFRFSFISYPGKIMFLY